MAKQEEIDRPACLIGMSDEDIVLRARIDPLAMDFILTKYKRVVSLKMRGYFIIGGDQEDLFQEGMIGLYRAVRDFNSEKLASFRTFAEMCITRQIITAIKKATRQKHELLNKSVSIDHLIAARNDDRTLLDTLPAKESPDPAFYVEREAASVGLQDRILETLSPLERSVLACYLRSGSYVDIASELQRGLKCIDNALQRAKRKIGLAIEESRSA